jgi:hypothetical protein
VSRLGYDDYPPGVWVDADGVLHFSVKDILLSRGIDPTPEAIERSHANLLAAMQEQLGPEAVIEVEP